MSVLVLLTLSFMAVIRCSTGLLGLLTSSFMAVIRCSTGLLVHSVPPVLSRDQKKLVETNARILLDKKRHY